MSRGEDEILGWGCFVLLLFLLLLRLLSLLLLLLMMPFFADVVVLDVVVVAHDADASAIAEGGPPLPHRIVDRSSLVKLELRVEKYPPSNPCPCGVLVVLSDLRACPSSLVIEGLYVAHVLNFALCRPWVDAPRVGGLSSWSIPSAVRAVRTSSHWALVAHGHTGAFFLLSENATVLTLSWGCLDMKMWLS